MAVHSRGNSGQKGDRQDESLTLPLFASPARKQRFEASRELVIAQPTLLHALKLAMEVGGCDDKQMAIDLEIDPGQWSRIMGGTAFYPTNKYLQFMQLCGNDIPLVWLAHQRGYELKPLRSDLQRQVDELTAEKAELQRQLETITEFVKRTRGGA